MIACNIVVPAVLGTILLASALLAVFVIFPAIEQKRYRDGSRPRRAAAGTFRAARADAEKDIDDGPHQNRGCWMNSARRPQADLDVLNELTRLLPPPVWTTSIEIYPDSVVITGEADQAAPLLKVLDSSPLFQNSEFALSVTRNGAGGTVSHQDHAARPHREDHAVNLSRTRPPRSDGAGRSRGHRPVLHFAFPDYPASSSASLADRESRTASRWRSSG